MIVMMIVIIYEIGRVESIFDLVAEDVVEAIVPEVVHYCVAIIYHVSESLYLPHLVCLLEGCHLPLQRYL